MCIIIDTNSLGLVFNTDSQDHASFAPVLKWIIEGKGKVVYGGSKYLDELSKTEKYLKVFLGLKKSRKAVEFDQDLIDQEHLKVIKLFEDCYRGKKSILVEIQRNDAEIDKLEKESSQRAIHYKLHTWQIKPDFDDPHLVALVRISGCKVVCTNDKRVVQFLKNPCLFNNSRRRPKIYRKETFKKAGAIINDLNIAQCCLPTAQKLPKNEVQHWLGT